MYSKELIQYITESAGELIGKAEAAESSIACDFLDEAEELLTLGALLLERHSEGEFSLKEAA